MNMKEENIVDVVDSSVSDKITSFLGSFLSNNLKTNQLEVNTDAQTSRSIARLKEPRDLFALPKDKDHECSQQTARWPNECQVLDERIHHIEYVPSTPEPYNQPTGRELQPRPVGDENGVIVYNYNPISAVNYNKASSNLKTSRNDSSDEDDDDDEEDEDDFGGNGSSTSFSRSPTPTKDDEEEEEEGGDITRIRNSNLSSSMDLFTKRFHDVLLKNTILPINNNNNNDNKSSRSSRNNNNIEENTSTNLNEQQQQETINKSSSNLNIQFSRSSVGGSKYLMNTHPTSPTDDYELIFESRFESGNLAKAVKITPVYYELYLRSDLYTNRHSQWFYFRVMNTKKGVPYRLSIVNLVKSSSLYNEGMKPLMYSTIDAKKSTIGWRRCGENISYFKNDEVPASSNNADEEDDYGYYTLTFNIEFPHDNDTVFFAHSYPYTYSDLQDYLMEIQRHPVKSKYCKLRLLCRSLAGNNVYYLTVTAPPTEEDTVKKKRAIVVSARVHPGETPSSWMMKGLMDFITGDSFVAKKLRHKFIFKLIPMLNPDGVIVGNTRSSLTGKDLNRQYRTVIRETYPSIWYTKTMIKRLTDECGVAMYCDMHAHSRKHNIFIYGCENKRTPDKKLTEQVFPLMLHKNVADKFSFENCKFKVQRNKEGTGRIVIWMLGITNSYTIEASFGGSTLGSRNATHFSTTDYEHIGRAFCETLMDYSDENPIKEKLRVKIVNRLNQEGSNADEPLNIPLSDYSSDEGDTSSSSSSDNEGKIPGRIYEGPCCQPLKVPPTSPVHNNNLQQQTVAQQQKQSIFGAAKSQDDKREKKYKKTTSKRGDGSRKIVHRKVTTRSVIELPTTKPEFELHVYCSSNDENNAGADDDDDTLIVHPPESTADGYDVSQVFRQMIRTEFRRSSTAIPMSCRSPSPTTIMANGSLTKIMPPELIITTAAPGTGNSAGIGGNGNTDKPPATAPAETNRPDKCSSFILELPPISNGQGGVIVGSCKRTGKRHNYNKCVPAIRVSNLNYDYGAADTNENLQVKLSLKKQIWTGVCVTENGTTMNGYEKQQQPLSWGVLPMMRKKDNQQNGPIDDHESLLLACSNRLTAWQLESEKRSTEKSKSLKACLKTKKISKNPDKMEQFQNLYINNGGDDNSSAVNSGGGGGGGGGCGVGGGQTTIYNNTNIEKKEQSPSPRIKHTNHQQNSASNQKKKIHSLTNVVNTTSFIIASRGGRNSTTLRKSSRITPSTMQTNQQYDSPYSLVPSQSQLTGLISTKSRNTTGGAGVGGCVGNKKNSNRFKTGGIVATAVQPSKRSRKNHHHHQNRTSLTAAAGITAVGATTAANSMAMPPKIVATVLDNQQSNLKEFVKKVKHKIKTKKKKSKSFSDVVAAGVTNG